MAIDRRELIVLAGVSALAAALPGVALESGETKMYGLIGRMIAAPGEREALIAILLQGVSGMPGCLSYVVARDPDNDDALWVTEVWESRERHQASLSLPSVQHAITRGKPLIAGFGERFETEPVGGHGLRAT